MTESGAVALSHFGLIVFAGVDAQSFLHGQLSCDVNGLAAGDATFGSYNTPKGRMLATFLLWRAQDGFMMLLPLELCEPVRRRLAMFVLRSKVTAQDATGRYSIAGVIGAAATGQVADALGEVPSAPLKATFPAGVQIVRLDMKRCIVLLDRTDRPDAAALLSQLPHLPPAAWTLADIRAGIPYLTPATQDQFVPQMANLDLIGGVSFNKGCYPGQEIVARTHYLGRLKQRMYLAKVDAPENVQPGAKLFSPVTGEQATGMVVNAAPAPEGGELALAVMHIDSFKGRDVHVNSPDGPKLEFLDLPYSIPE